MDIRLWLDNDSPNPWLRLTGNPREIEVLLQVVQFIENRGLPYLTEYVHDEAGELVGIGVQLGNRLEMPTKFNLVPISRPSIDPMRIIFESKNEKK